MALKFDSSEKRRKFNFLTVLIMNKTYSIRAPNTKRMQTNIQASIAVSPSALGVLVVTVLKMLTSTRNKVTRSAIRPGITSMGMRNDIQDTITNRPITSIHKISNIDSVSYHLRT